MAALAARSLTQSGAVFASARATVGTDAPATAANTANTANIARARIHGS
jgi:hypothetical protein